MTKHNTMVATSKVEPTLCSCLPNTYPADSFASSNICIMMEKTSTSPKKAKRCNTSCHTLLDLGSIELALALFGSIAQQIVNANSWPATIPEYVPACERQIVPFLHLWRNLSMPTEDWKSSPMFMIVSSQASSFLIDPMACMPISRGLGQLPGHIASELIVVDGNETI